MRILHTSDWHLGRLFHNVSLISDQAEVLDRLIEIVRAETPDVVVIAGDVYDRAVPPGEAVELLDDTLSCIVRDCGVPVVLIAGNHDSPERLGFGRRLLEAERLFVRGRMEASVEPIVIQDAYGPLDVYALPYVDPGDGRAVLEEAGAGIRDHETLFAAAMTGVRHRRNAGRRAIVVAHAFVTGGKVSESERPIAVGGTGTVAADHFADFDYVALGHLHRPQSVQWPHIRYSGSLFKYSFSEVDHRKSVTIAEFDANGFVGVREIPLSSRRDVKIVSGTIAELTSGPLKAPAEDYLRIVLLDDGPVLDAMARLRTVYPNVLHLERPRLSASLESQVGAVASHDRLSPESQFPKFFEAVTGQTLTDQQLGAFRRAAAVARDDEAGGLPGTGEAAQ